MPDKFVDPALQSRKSTIAGPAHLASRFPPRRECSKRAQTDWRAAACRQPGVSVPSFPELVGATPPPGGSPKAKNPSGECSPEGRVAFFKISDGDHL